MFNAQINEPPYIKHALSKAVPSSEPNSVKLVVSLSCRLLGEPSQLLHYGSLMKAAGQLFFKLWLESNKPTMTQHWPDEAPLL